MEVFIAAILVFSLMVAWLSLAPWLPTQFSDLEVINEAIGLKEGEKFVEIGCGNARVCSFVARRNPGVNVIGIELALPFYVFSKIRGWIFGPRNMKIEFGNALYKKFFKVDVVYVFGIKQTVNGRLKAKMEKELKKGARFVSYVFEVDGWKGEREKTVLGPEGAKIFVYER